MATQTNKGPNVGFANPAQFFSNADRLLGQAVAGANEIGDRMVERQKNKAVNQIMTNRIDSNQKVEDFRNEQTSNLANIGMIDPMESAKLVNAQVNPIQAQRNADRLFGFNETKEESLVDYRDDVTTETNRHNKAMEEKVTPKGYGAITDEYGTTYIYNKDSGKYEPIVNGSAGKGGVRITNKTPKMALPDGTKVYQDGRGNPILGSDGKPIVVERSKTNLDIPTTEANFETLITRLDEGITTVGKNEGAVGSFGSDPLGFIANNINDIVQMPTDDFRDRTKIKGYSNALVGTIYKMVETGVMTDADAERYLSMVPKPDDSPTIYKDKAKRLRDELTDNRKSIRKKMGIDGDYDNGNSDADVKTTDANTGPTLGGVPVIFTD